MQTKACPFCAKKSTRDDYKDYLSKKEFDMTGMCQACQDKTFVGGEQ